MGPRENGNRSSKKGWETAWAAQDRRGQLHISYPFAMSQEVPLTAIV